MNLKHLLESLIAEAMEDEKELIDTDKLPSALVIAKRIEELEEALRGTWMIAHGLTKLYDNPNSGFDKGYTMASERIAEYVQTKLKALDSSKNS